jgi:hypothetical protein
MSVPTPPGTGGYLGQAWAIAFGHAVAATWASALLARSSVVMAYAIASLHWLVMDLSYVVQTGLVVDHVSG